MTIKEFIEDYTTYTPESYSGRYMYGKNCLSIYIGHLDELAQLAFDAGKVGCDESILNYVYDQMGKGYVVYWKDEVWEEDEGEDLEDEAEEVEL